MRTTDPPQHKAMRLHRLYTILAFLLLFGAAVLTAQAAPVHIGSSHAIGRNGSFEHSRTSAVSRGGRDELDDVILSEDFETTAPGQLPAFWQEIDRDSGYCSWFRRLSTWQVYAHPGFSAHSGTRFGMCHFNDNAVANDDWLILPQQNLSGTISLSYWVAAQDPDYPETYEIRVSTGAPQPQNFTNLVFTGSSFASDWTNQTHDLSAFAGSPFWIAFHYISVDRFALKIDDVQLAASGALTGTIAGIVSDDSASGISYAAVQIISLGQSARTDSSGSFILSRVPVGTYSLFVNQEFYSAHAFSGVIVNANDTTTLNATLHPLALQFAHYVSSSNQRQIADFDTCNMLIVATDTVLIHDMDVTVTLTHSYVGDLDIWLRAPDHTWVQLIAHDSLNAGQNITNCRFDDQADLSFAAGQAPYTGRFRPVQPLGRLVGDSLIHLTGGQPVGAYWLLYVYDAYAGDEGTLLGFSMDVAWQAPLGADHYQTAQPEFFSFTGNYPNPCNSETRFQFTLPHAGQARLILYNVLGQEIARIIDGALEAGNHDVLFDASSLASGVYLARLSASGSSVTRKVLLIR